LFTSVTLRNEGSHVLGVVIVLVVVIVVCFALSSCLLRVIKLSDPLTLPTATDSCQLSDVVIWLKVNWLIVVSDPGKLVGIEYLELGSQINLHR
jgi:hypothetical protein